MCLGRGKGEGRCRRARRFRQAKRPMRIKGSAKRVARYIEDVTLIGMDKNKYSPL